MHTSPLQYGLAIAFLQPSYSLPTAVRHRHQSGRQLQVGAMPAPVRVTRSGDGVTQAGSYPSQLLESESLLRQGNSAGAQALRELYKEVTALKRSRRPHRLTRSRAED
jgi:hypothetical protein